MIRGGSEGLPKPDYTKTFEVKSLSGFDWNVDAPLLEMKAAELPVFMGNLKALPLTEWSGARNEIYPKAVSLRELEIKQAIARWSQLTELKQKEAIFQSESEMAAKSAALPSAPVPSPMIFPGPTLKTDDGKPLWGQGVEAGDVTVGEGFNKVRLSPMLREPPGTKSPPKSDSLR